MARALWKGVISFGLVNVPVELHTAVRDSRPRFRLLHAKDQSIVKYERVCQREGKPVAWEDLVKGYEYEKGHFVALTKDDFRAAALEKSQSIDIVDFVPAEQIDDRFFETPYYVVPGKGGDRGYALLREAIRQSGRIGIGKIILRESQHLAALTAVGDTLVLTLMRFADELVDRDEFKVPSATGLRSKELDLAKQLVEQLAADWDARKYSDDYRANLMRLIHAKLKGKHPERGTEPRPQETAVVDLMERLRRSLETRQTKRHTNRAPRGKKGRRPARQAA